MDRVLFAPKGSDVDKFPLKCGQVVDPGRAEGWIWHNVRELELDFVEHDFGTPIGLFTCKTLVTLKLQMEESFVEKIPFKVSLPRLKILYLELIEFSDDDSVKRLFSSCTALEELVVQNCNFEYMNISFSNSTLKILTISYYPGVYEHVNVVLINAPSLVYFKYFHFISKYHLFIDIHSLVEAYIDFGPVLNSMFYDSGTTDLIRGISHVQTLHLSGPFSEVCFLILVSC